MGRVSQLAVRAAELAIADAGLTGSPIIASGATGVSSGSSTGSTADISAFAAMILHADSSGLNANSYVRMMPHTTAANVGIFFGAKGRIIPTSSACTSGSQGIGYAYEAIKFGRQDVMIAGGAEELCPTEAMAFDTLYATSRRNDQPHTTPRPYDRDRDGLVVGEGGGDADSRGAGACSAARCAHSRGAGRLRQQFRRRARHQAGRDRRCAW